MNCFLCNMSAQYLLLDGIELCEDHLEIASETFKNLMKCGPTQWAYTLLSILVIQKKMEYGQNLTYSD